MGIENPVHLLFIAAVALVALGPKRLPGLARALGQGIREFRTALEEASAPHEPASPALEPAAAPDAPAVPQDGAAVRREPIDPIARARPERGPDRVR